MREIKFRQWIKRRKSFHFWGFTKEGVECFIGPENFQDESEQYTSLKDKNGREIYEGDIMDYRKECGALHVVKWSEGFGEGSVLGIDCSGTLGITMSEVIGNIHENPELLEAERG